MVSLQMQSKMDRLFKKFLSKTAFLLLSCSALLFTACNSDSGTENTETEKVQEEEISLDMDVTREDVAREDFQRMLDEVPKPTQVPMLIEESGVEFNESLPLPVSQTESYMTTSDQAALALGVYGSDLGYMSVYGKAQEAIDYLNANQRLIEHIGISNALEATLLKRFEANLSNTDSLVSIVNESIDFARDYLAESERFESAALIATGSMIEGLYIATSLVKNYPQDVATEQRSEQLKNLIKTILMQKESLEDLVTVLDVVNYQDEKYVQLKDEVSELYDMYDLIGVEQQLERNPEELLQEETLNDITTKVAEIRGMIINI